MLTEFYERCSKYYGAAGGQGAYGCASEDEKRLTMTLFLSIFESLAQMDYDPELFGKVGGTAPFLPSLIKPHGHKLVSSECNLDIDSLCLSFSKALPCLTAIACALPPDYAKSGNGHADDDGGAVKIVSNVGPYTPSPIHTAK